MARSTIRRRSGRRSTGRLRLPPNGVLLAAAVGAVLVLLNGLLVLGPVVGLVGAAASTGPALDVPVVSSTLVVVAGYLVAVVLLVGAWFSRRVLTAGVLAGVAWVLTLVVSLWPLVATATSAVDRVRDVLPWISDLVSRVG